MKKFAQTVTVKTTKRKSRARERRMKGEKNAPQPLEELSLQWMKGGHVRMENSNHDGKKARLQTVEDDRP